MNFMKQSSEGKQIQFQDHSALLEKYSSAFTLSDMEIFIFPELLYALVLANIMSPEIWKWRDDPWFVGIGKMGPIKKIHRVKQYIMDHYYFNLDLETWGLTDKQTEINRFREFFDMELLSKSNALFGYEGDKYYFDLDIRKHFGLDHYDSDVIPYWKTETIEAMNAFRFKPNHDVGAGECVSLACLYAAALFIVAKVPLEKIFLMGTPLHSQNFVMVNEGVLTNNRRIVTKSMWFNGTELSALARRALEHEQVTYVSHITGYIHSTFSEASINPEMYRQYREKITSFLETNVDFEIFMNFLRDYSRYQKLFQLSFLFQGVKRYIPLEKAYGYEHGSKHRLGDKTGRNLLTEIDEEDFIFQPIDQRIILEIDNQIFNTKSYIDFIRELREFYPSIENHTDFFMDLKKFVHTIPRLPSENKNFNRDYEEISISIDQSRAEIIDYLQKKRLNHSNYIASGSVIDLSFYVGRYMDSCDWKPFFKAAFERNPVSLTYFLDKELFEVYQELDSWDDESIYEGNRLAMPDEVVNFKRGDGIEKVITLVNVARSRKVDYKFQQKNEIIHVLIGGNQFDFVSYKDLKVKLI